MESITIQNCVVASVRADMLKGRVKITFETVLDAQLLEAKRMLAILAIDASPVDLTVTEQQMRLPLKGFNVSEPRAGAVGMIYGRP